MTKKLVIGICGYAGAGKDTLAKAMRDRWPKSIGHAAFADPMRAMLLALGVPREHMEDRELKEQPVPGFGLSYRHLAQTLGTEWGRACNGEDFWLNAAAARVAAMPESIITITDVRFPNEAAWVQKNGTLVRVDRPRREVVRPHASEEHIGTFVPDLAVSNHGPIEAMDALAEYVLSFSLERFFQSPLNPLLLEWDGKPQGPSYS